MATLKLSAECVEAALRRILAGRFRSVSVTVEDGKAVVSVTKFISLKFRLWCDQPVVDQRVRFHYAGSVAAAIALTFAKKQILCDFPFIEKLESGECVIDAGRIDVAGRPLTGWAEIKKLELPGAEGSFCALEFTVKENATCPN